MELTSFASPILDRWLNQLWRLAESATCIRKLARLASGNSYINACCLASIPIAIKAACVTTLRIDRYVDNFCRCMSIQFHSLCWSANSGKPLPRLLSKKEIALQQKKEAACRQQMIDAYNSDKRHRQRDEFREFESLWIDSSLDENDFKLPAPLYDLPARAAYVLTDFTLSDASRPCEKYDGVVHEFCRLDLEGAAPPPPKELLVQSIDA